MSRSTELAKLRKQIFLAGYKAGLAHLASCFSCLEMIYAMYEDVLKLDANNPSWEQRDRFILSKGHAGLALYAVLAHKGLVRKDILEGYLDGMDGIGGEPCILDCPYVEASTGSLGHGLSLGLGMAMALKMDGNPAKVYVMLGDGECEEGSVWEAAMQASAFGLDNLIAIMDCNKIQKMDYVKNIIGEPDWKKKWVSFGWDADEVDGHDINAFEFCVQKNVKAIKPRIVIAHTIKGKGVSVMENNPDWHFRLPRSRDLRIFMKELNISEEEHS